MFDLFIRANLQKEMYFILYEKVGQFLEYIGQEEL